MKNNVSRLGFLGLIGICGILLKSWALAAFLLYLPLLFLAGKEQDDELKAGVNRAWRNSGVVSLVLFGSVFMFTAVLKALPITFDSVPYDVLLLILSSALCICFAAGIFVFVISALFIVGKKR